MSAVSDPTKKVNNSLGALKYHPQIIQILGIDTEWSRNYESANDFLEPLQRAVTDLQKRCNELRREAWGESDTTEDNCFAEDGMFSVMPFLPIGHADLIAAVITDDFETLHETVSGIQTTIEEVSTGLCPVVESLYNDLLESTWVADEADILAWAKTATAREIFVSMPHLFSANQRSDQRGTHGEVYARQPLMMFTSLKLEGLITLGLGLEIEHAVCRAMLRNLIRTLYHITHRDFSIFNEQFELDLPNDLESLRISLIDLQSQEEFGLFSLTRNFTLTEALLARLQALTVEDVLGECSHLRGNFDDLPYLKKIKKLYCDFEGINYSEEKHSTFFRGNHVLRWLRTAAAVSCSRSNCLSHLTENATGFLESFTEIQIPTGHQGWLIRNASFSSLEGSIGSPPVKYSRHTLGRCDCMVYNGRQESGIGESRNLIGVKEFFQWVESTLLNVKNGWSEKEKPRWRNLVGWSSSISIPVPVVADQNGIDYYCPIVGTGHHTAFDSVLIRLKERLFSENGTDYLNRSLLRARLKTANIPRPLRRSIINLYDNYFLLLTNPHLFEQVVDLLDVFQTLYEVITKTSASTTFSSKQLDHLCKFAGAINWALEHRLYRAFPEDRVRDAEIDYRGGLNQLLSAVDTVQKCAIGIIRHHVLDYSQSDTQAATSDVEDILEVAKRRNRIGVLQFVGFMPGIKMNISDFGRNGPKLAVVKSDVAHLHHVPSFHDFWHEAFHLIQDIVIEQGGIKKRDNEESYSEQGDGWIWKWPVALSLRAPFDPDAHNDFVTSQQRISEVFSHILTSLFISPHDPLLVGEHLALQFACSIRSISANNNESFVFFLEKRLESFVALDALISAKQFFVRNNCGRELVSYWEMSPSQRADFLKRDAADAIFGPEKSHIERAKQYLLTMDFFPSSHTEMLNSPDNSKSIEEKIRKFLVTTRPFLSRLVGISFEIYRRSRSGEFNNECTEETLQAIERSISDNVFNNGSIPSTEWHLCPTSGKSHKIDSSFLLCSALQGILRKRVELYRTRRVAGGDESPTREVLKCDALAGGGMVCTDKQMRLDRSIRYINVLKSCEGATSVLRANRVEELCGFF